MDARFFIAALKAKGSVHELAIHALSILTGEHNAVERALGAVKVVLDGGVCEAVYLTPLKTVKKIQRELAKMSPEFKDEFIKRTLESLRPKLERELQISGDEFRHDFKAA